MNLNNRSLKKMGLAATWGAIAVGLYVVPAKAQMHGGSPHHSPETHQSPANTDHLSALDANEASAHRLFNEGLEKLHAADDQGAIENFGKAIALSPRHEDAYISRGNVYRKLGKHQEAIDNYTQAIQLNPTFTYLYNSRGNLREELKDYNGAIADYTEAIRLYPEESAGYRNLGSVHYKLGDYKAALSSLNQAVEVNSGSASAYLKRGELYVKLDDCEQAMNDFHQAAKLFSAQGNEAEAQRVTQLLRALQKQHSHLRTKP